MDRFIAALDARQDGDLMFCDREGIAYQADQTNLVAYDAAYFDKCAGYRDQDIAKAINAGRVQFVNSRVGAHGSVLDVGIGSGEFIDSRGGHTSGTDVNPVAIAWLKDRGLFATDLRNGFAGYTFWDVLEHLPTPEDYFSKIGLGCFLFTSLPIFDELDRIRASKHYRPNEHLFFWTEFGFLEWMHWHGFQPLEADSFETRAGREAIRSFAFRRYRWPTR